MHKFNNNKSLILYTGLIFVAAIIMIILAFFGQANMQKNQPIKTETASITEKAAQLSEDNRILLEQNLNFQNENKELRQENKNLETEVESLTKETENNNLLLEIYNLLYRSKKTMARERLDTVVVEELTESQKVFYQILVKKSK